MGSIHSRDGGFTLVEACIASLILSIGIASVFQLLLLGAASTRAAGDATRAAVIAAQKLEELRSLPWPLMTDGDDRTGSFVRTWSVEPMAADPTGTVAMRIVVERAGGGPAGTAVLYALRTRIAP
jgi:Tfp pilus assembly protein PilV